MSLAVEDLEAAWEQLAEAVDAAGPGRARLMLAKLALLLANELGDPARFAALVRAALQDLG